MAGRLMTHPMLRPLLLADGATLTFDNLDRLDLAQVCLHDPVSAEPWLTAVLGPQTSRQVLTGAVSQVRVPPSLTRLALALWMRRCWPASPRLGIPELPADILSLEAAVLAQEWEDLLGPEEVSAPDLLEAATASGQPLAAPSGALAQEELALAAGGTGAAGGTPGADPAALRSETGDVDWALVPPGTLDAAPGTLTWSVRASGTSAEVAARVTGVLAPLDLVATWHHGTTAVLRLPLPVGGSVALASRRVDDAVAATLLEGATQVSVAAASVARPELLGPEHRTTAAEREQVRAWALRRQDAAGGLLLSERL